MLQLIRKCLEIILGLLTQIHEIYLERCCLIEWYKLWNAAELKWSWEPIVTIFMTNFDKFITSPLAQCQGVFSPTTAGVADQVGPVRSVLQLLVDLLPGDVAPVPLGLQEAGLTWTPARHRPPSNSCSSLSCSWHGRRCWEWRWGDVVLGHLLCQPHSVTVTHAGPYLRILFYLKLNYCLY